MSPALRAHDLCPLHSIARIHVPFDGAGDRVEESRPPTPAVELVIGRVERCPAAGAVVRSLILVVLILPCAGGLGTLLTEDPELLFFFFVVSNSEVLNCR